MKLSNDELRDALSQTIKEYRIANNLTQEQLADLSYISVEFIRDIEAGRSGMSLLTFINVCCALKITPNQALKKIFNNYTGDDILEKINFLDNHNQDIIKCLVQFLNENENNNKSE